VLDPSGSNLLYSTYLGGTGADAGTGIALDSAGDIYLTGITGSRDFPITNALLFQLSGTTNTTLDRLAGTNNAFVTEIAADGSALIFSTYFGGKKFDEGESIAVDGGGYIYVAGFTESTNFPTINAFQPKLNRGSKKISAKGSVDNDAFVAKFNPSGAGLVYSTFLGGTNKDTAFDIATDGAGNAYITGSSASLDFWNTNTMTSASGTNVIPGLRSALTQKNGSSTDAFLTKLDPNGVLIYSVLFGGKTNDFGYGVVVDSAGDAFVVGATASTNFPVFIPIGTSGFPNPTVNATKKNKGFDSFVTAVKADATGLLYSLYVGGRGNDFCYGIAIDAAANVYMVGQTTSTNFPTVNAFQTTIHGTNDTFLLKIEP
jgi:hypothetical protein